MILILIHILSSCLYVISIQQTESTWEKLIAPVVSSTKFTPRNNHASCVFRNKIWLTGGRTNEYRRYNLKPGYKTSDVWTSVDGVIWTQETQLLGDFYAQNADAIQPGPIAPWYARFGHTLTALDLNGDGQNDIMILLGGYAPTPINDIWITEDGITWIYCGLAPWLPRAWHTTVLLQDTLYIMGGTPLNNDVWSVNISSIQKINRTALPLTRAFYLSYTYTMMWKQEPNAPWSPRCGMGAISQWYYNETYQIPSQGSYRILLIGGYGGWLDSSSSMFPYTQGNYDGIRCRADVWSMDIVGNWTLLNGNASFLDRGWFGLVSAASSADSRVDIASNRIPRIFLIGGGNIGFSTTSSAIIELMEGKVDTYFTRDGINWKQVNYQEGGGTSPLSLYSSQEWAKTTIDGKILYIGLWGMTVVPFDFSDSSSQVLRKFLLVAGDQTGKGSATNLVYRSLPSLMCQINGVTCDNRGQCDSNSSRCLCNTVGRITYTGEYCDDLILNPSSAYAKIKLGYSFGVVVSLILVIVLPYTILD